MLSSTRPHRILFVCRHNAFRSQLAEALTRSISHGRVEVASAGVEPAPVPASVVEWISRIPGAANDIRSKSLDEFKDQHFDTIVTLCDKSHGALPEHPEDRQHVRWDFHHPDDPESLRHLEIELSERIRVFLSAIHQI